MNFNLYTPLHLGVGVGVGVDVCVCVGVDMQKHSGRHMAYGLNCCMQIETFVYCCVLLLFQSFPHPKRVALLFIIVKVFTAVPSIKFKCHTIPRSRVFL